MMSIVARRPISLTPKLLDEHVVLPALECPSSFLNTFYDMVAVQLSLVGFANVIIKAFYALSPNS